METIRLQSEVSFDALLNGVEQMNTQDLERFANQVLVIRARRRAPTLPRRESELLQQINQRLPVELEHKFGVLTAKRRSETLTPDEHQELLELVDEIEQRDAKRVEYLAELAQLRNVPLRTLMAQLGIQPPAYA